VARLDLISLSGEPYRDCSLLVLALPVRAV
jgi:hypothetical protein